MLQSLGLVLAWAAAAAAALTAVSTTYPIPGVDASGNPSAISGLGSGKIYKESRTGIVFGTFVGVVPNRSGASTNFVNQGLPITDPVTKETRTATADVEVVATPSGILSQASLVLAYFPTSD